MKQSEDGHKEFFELKLFITGMATSSARAMENLKDICDDHLDGNYSLEIVDIYKNPEILEKEDIIACPTLIKYKPLPGRRVIGDLSNTEKVIRVLGIK